MILKLLFTLWKWQKIRHDQDVYIDILGYRRYGHNEGDEPRFTQPLLYKTISSTQCLYIICQNWSTKSRLLNKKLLIMKNHLKKLPQKQLDDAKNSPEKNVLICLNQTGKGFDCLKKVILNHLLKQVFHCKRKKSYENDYCSKDFNVLVVKNYYLVTPF